jgi:hypothetical protein
MSDSDNGVDWIGCALGSSLDPETSALCEIVELIVAHSQRQDVIDCLPRPNPLALVLFPAVKLATLERRQTLSFFDRHQPSFRIHPRLFAHRQSPHVSAQIRASIPVSVYLVGLE